MRVDVFIAIAQTNLLGAETKGLGTLEIAGIAESHAVSGGIRGCALGLTIGHGGAIGQAFFEPVEERFRDGGEHGLE